MIFGVIALLPVCGKNVETAEASDPPEVYPVYVCDGENVYHWDDECEMMKCDVVETMSEDESAQRGYEPCEHCLSSVVIEEVSAEEEL